MNCEKTLINHKNYAPSTSRAFVPLGGFLQFKREVGGVSLFRSRP